MSSDRIGQEQPGLWDEEMSSTGSPEPPRRHQPWGTKAATTIRSADEPRSPTIAPPATRPDLSAQDLWDADRVAAYLGVPKQTLYAWRHSGKGPKGFRVGKHLRWRAQTVVEWTLTLERDQ